MKSKVLDIGDGRYTIFKNGEILCKRNSKRSYGFFRKKEISKKGYWVVHFKVNHKRIVRQMHRLLACAFIPNPENKPTVNHKDGNKLNNELSNLEWATHKENNWHSRYVLKNNHNTEQQREAARKVMRVIGKNQGEANRKLSYSDAINLINDRLELKMRTVDLSKKYDLSKSSVLRILRGESYNINTSTFPN